MIYRTIFLCAAASFAALAYADKLTPAQELFGPQYKSKEIKPATPAGTVSPGATVSPNVSVAKPTDPSVASIGATGSKPAIVAPAPMPAIAPAMSLDLKPVAASPKAPTEASVNPTVEKKPVGGIKPMTVKAVSQDNKTPAPVVEARTKPLPDVNPFTGEARAYEMKHRQLEEAQVDTKLLQENLNQENIKMQADLVRFRKQSEISRLSGTGSAQRNVAPEKGGVTKKGHTPSAAADANQRFVPYDASPRTTGTMRIGDEQFTVTESNGATTLNVSAGGDPSVASKDSGNHVTEVYRSDNQPPPTPGSGGAGGTAPAIGGSFPGLIPPPQIGR